MQNSMKLKHSHHVVVAVLLLLLGSLIGYSVGAAQEAADQADGSFVQSFFAGFKKKSTQKTQETITKAETTPKSSATSISNQNSSLEDSQSEFKKTVATTLSNGKTSLHLYAYPNIDAGTLSFVLPEGWVKRKKVQQRRADIQYEDGVFDRVIDGINYQINFQVNNQDYLKLPAYPSDSVYKTLKTSAGTTLYILSTSVPSDNNGTEGDSYRNMWVSTCLPSNGTGCSIDLGNGQSLLLYIYPYKESDQALDPMNLKLQSAQKALSDFVNLVASLSI